MQKNFLFILLILPLTGILAQETDTVGTDAEKFTKLRLGGYGEMLFQHMDYGPDRYNYIDGSQPDNRALVDIPRLILSLDYKFRPDIELCTEIEFEHGGTGSALELEYEEMGEYEMEMEKAGEVVLEQFHISKTFSDAFILRAGHMIVPVGLTNTHHLPVEFFGTVRPESETAIIPLTWHETGIALLGRYRKWSYEFQVVNGLDANGFSSAYWVRKGKQAIFESTKMTDPAFVARIDNKSIKNLRLGLSYYVGNSTGNTAKPEKMEHLKGTVAIGAFDFQFKTKSFIFRGNGLYGNLTDSYEISRINKSISKNIQYPRTPVAKNALSYAVEAGYDVLSLFDLSEKLFLFGRHEYYNSMEGVDDKMLADSRYKRNVTTVGLNYFILPNLVLKCDYAMRSVDKGNYNSENTLGLGLAYAGWFVKK